MALDRPIISYAWTEAQWKMHNHLKATFVILLLSSKGLMHIVKLKLRICFDGFVKIVSLCRWKYPKKYLFFRWKSILVRHIPYRDFGCLGHAKELFSNYVG